MNEHISECMTLSFFTYSIIHFPQTCQLLVSQCRGNIGKVKLDQEVDRGNAYKDFILIDNLYIHSFNYN